MYVMNQTYIYDLIKFKLNFGNFHIFKKYYIFNGYITYICYAVVTPYNAMSIYLVNENNIQNKSLKSVNTPCFAIVYGKMVFEYNM